MSTTSPTAPGMAPSRVHDVLAKHILADGLSIVLDLDKSRGAYLYDSRHDRRLLDFFTCYSTIPVATDH